MKVKNTVLCNDIRKEENGKFILVGVFADNILFPDFPGYVPLALWTQILFEEEGAFEIEFRITLNRKTLVAGAGLLEITDHQIPSTIALPTVRVRIEHEGILRYDLKVADRRWRTLKEIPIGTRHHDN